MPSIAAEPLIDFATALLNAGGIGRDEAAIVARSLVGANLRGHDSHGVMRIPYYLDQLAKGNCNRPHGCRFLKRSTHC